jgi:hypothetical protein
VILLQEAVVIHLQVAMVVILQHLQMHVLYSQAVANAHFKNVNGHLLLVKLVSKTLF